MNLPAWAAAALVMVMICYPAGSVAQNAYSPDDLVAEHLVSLPDGRRLNVSCFGSGEPAVVFEQGLGAHILSWEKVAPAIAHDTTSCVYDRAGQGYSDPSKKPMTALNVVDDLHDALVAKGIKTPVVLVGHSIGGLYATLYADRYFNSVAGLVLVDPSFSGQDVVPIGAQAHAQMEAGFRDEQKLFSTCAETARSGKLGEGDPKCPWNFAPNRTPAEKAYLSYQYSLPFKYEGTASEGMAFYSAEPRKSEDAVEEDSLRRSFGALPMIVLTAGDDHEPPTFSTTEIKALADSWRSGHDALAARSTKGQSLVVEKAAHFIQIDQPDAVIAAIRTVLNEARSERQ